MITSAIAATVIAAASPYIKLISGIAKESEEVINVAFRLRDKLRLENECERVRKLRRRIYEATTKKRDLLDRLADARVYPDKWLSVKAIAMGFPSELHNMQQILSIDGYTNSRLAIEADAALRLLTEAWSVLIEEWPDELLDERDYERLVEIATTIRSMSEIGVEAIGKADRYLEQIGKTN